MESMKKLIFLFHALVCVLLLLSIAAVFAAAGDDDSAAAAATGQAQQDGGLDPGNTPDVVGKALVCFNHVTKCQEKFRLGSLGTLDVAKDETDEYCNGGCSNETLGVLNCLDNIMSNFQFYNNATINDVRITVNEACSNSSKRGDFDVSQRITATSTTTISSSSSSFLTSYAISYLLPLSSSFMLSLLLLLP